MACQGPAGEGLDDFCLLLLKKRPIHIPIVNILHTWIFNFPPPWRQSQKQLFLGQYYFDWLGILEEYTWSIGAYASSFGGDRKQSLSATLDPVCFPNKSSPRASWSHKHMLNQGGNHSINTVGVVFLREKSGSLSPKRQQWIMSNLRFGIGKTLTNLPQNKELKIREKKMRTEERKEVSATDRINHSF